MQALLAEMNLRGDGPLLGILILLAAMAIFYVFIWRKSLRKTAELSDEEIVDMIRQNPINDNGLDLTDPATFNLIPGESDDGDYFDDGALPDDAASDIDLEVGDEKTMRVVDSKSGECISLLCVDSCFPDEFVIGADDEDDDPNSDPRDDEDD